MNVFTVSYQLSAISHQLSAISHQPSGGNIFLLTGVNKICVVQMICYQKTLVFKTLLSIAFF